MVFNLYAFTCIFLQVFLSCTFWRVKKYQKRPAQTKWVTTLFCSCHVVSTRSSVVCHSQLIVQALGAKGLALHALTATLKTPLKHLLPFFQCLNGCSLSFRQCRFSFDITSACVKSTNHVMSTERMRRKFSSTMLAVIVTRSAGVISTAWDTVSKHCQNISLQLVESVIFNRSF